ncbi:MAG: peptide chain release factor 2 [Patescibacteria group bacterium]|nr:peptide chain release factor 2 [Patescibacteria group bacterium]
MSDIALQLKELEEKLFKLEDAFDLKAKKEMLKGLEKKMQNPDFWKDKDKAIEVSQEVSRISEEIIGFDILKEEFAKIENQKEAEEFEKKLKDTELQVFLSGKYDKNNAILQIISGAGGIDAQDWATMLVRMFQKYCVRKGFKIKVLHQSFGEAGGPEGRIGTKAATLQIKGAYSYGFLKNESGVHRLVRQSPFSVKKLRHTSFVLVEVLPEIGIKEQEEIEINPEDLRVETFRSSGPGGQHVNRRESAVRITHLPSKIVVSSQSERLQGLNKAEAMKVLYAKLYRLKEEKRKEELKKIKGKTISVGWGSQIRSYVLHPYKLVKDTRTGVETSNTEEVLNGNLDQFIEAEISIDQ